MCFNKESSIILFASSLCLSLYLYKIGDNTLKVLSIFMIYVAIAQLLEFFLWSNIKCNSINKFISKLIPIYLFGQPLIFLLSVYYFKVTTFNSSYLIYPIILYILVFLRLIYEAITSTKNPCCTVENNSLKWNTIYGDDINLPSYISYNFFSLYWIPLILLLFLKNKIYSLIVLSLLLITLFITSTYNKRWYSYWCFSANIIPAVLIVMKLFFKI